MIQNEKLNFIGDQQHFPSTALWVTGTATAATMAALAYTLRQRKANKPSAPAEPPPKFTSESLTASFVAAIPSITRELNLEVATATQTETFTRSSTKTALWGWLDLGANVAQVRVPVTYRFHICLRDLWKLEVNDNNVTVHAPVLRPSLPPAIHTDQIERLSVRGWCRGSPKGLLADLERQITPELCQYASSPKQLNQVREACRLSVAEFVRLWLEHERQWHPAGLTTIQVQFADESTLPAGPTLKLLQ